MMEIKRKKSVLNCIAVPYGNVDFFYPLPIWDMGIMQCFLPQLGDSAGDSETATQQTDVSVHIGHLPLTHRST